MTTPTPADTPPAGDRADTTTPPAAAPNPAPPATPAAQAVPSDATAGADLVAERTAREDAERRATEAEAEVARLRRANAAVKGVDLDGIRAELRAEFVGQIVRAEVRAAAAGRFKDAGDVLALVDLDALAANGEPDPAAITAALDKLLTDKPYLGAETAPAPAWGDVGSGPRTAASKNEPGTPMDKLRRAYETPA